MIQLLSGVIELWPLLRPEPVNRVEFLGHGNLKFEQKEDGLEVILPENNLS